MSRKNKVFQKEEKKMTTQAQTIIAVSIAELNKFGCPYCGYRSGSSHISGGGTVVWQCGSEECNRTCCALAEGVTKSTIGIGGDFYPELQAHPRRGIPSHGRPDKKPEGGGEFFYSRGIGSEWNLTCFCCGARDAKNRPANPHQAGNGLLNNIAAFVECKTAGERVVAMFKHGARLDYRESESDRVQVKIGACNKHLRNLKKIDALTKDGIITANRITKAMA
jgi:hypothetical protein